MDQSALCNWLIGLFTDSASVINGISQELLFDRNGFKGCLTYLLCHKKLHVNL